MCKAIVEKERTWQSLAATYLCSIHLIKHLVLQYYTSQEDSKACRDLFPHHSYLQQESVFTCVCVGCCSGVVNIPPLHVLTFSSSWRSCLLLASLEHRLCSGATTVQIQRPSASWAELYTCQPSFGPIVCKHKQIL